MAQAAAEEVERFRPTNGRVMGVLGLLLCLVVVAVFVLSESPHVAVPGVLACAAAALLIWMALLRPHVAATRTHLHLQNLFERVSIPLASIDTVVVRRYLLVRAGGRKFICPAISRPLRKTMRKETGWRGSTMMAPGVSEDQLATALKTDVKEHDDLNYPDFVEQRILGLAADDRARRGIKERSEEEYALGSQVERHVRWRELGVLALLVVAFAISLLA